MTESDIDKHNTHRFSNGGDDDAEVSHGVNYVTGKPDKLTRGMKDDYDTANMSAGATHHGGNVDETEEHKEMAKAMKEFEEKEEKKEEKKL